MVFDGFFIGGEEYRCDNGQCPEVGPRGIRRWGTL